MSAVRRLPYYFLVDTSACDKANAEACRDLILSIVDTMRSNPYHLETAHLSVIKFGAESKVVVPLVDVCAFGLEASVFEPGCGLAHALSLLMKHVQSDLVVTTQAVRGDLRPIVVLWLMSEPSDDFAVRLDALDAIKTGRKFAFVSRAVPITKRNRLKDSGFSVISEDTGAHDAKLWYHDIVNCPFDHMEDPVMGPGDDESNESNSGS